MYFDCANERGLAVAGLNFPPVYADFPHEPVSWGRRELAAWGTGVSMRGVPRPASLRDEDVLVLELGS